jgi:hypothetical protein
MPFNRPIIFRHLALRFAAIAWTVASLPTAVDAQGTSPWERAAANLEFTFTGHHHRDQRDYAIESAARSDQHQGDYPSPRGCTGTLLSVGNAETRTIATAMTMNRRKCGAKPGRGAGRRRSQSIAPASPDA